MAGDEGLQIIQLGGELRDELRDNRGERDADRENAAVPITLPPNGRRRSLPPRRRAPERRGRGNAGGPRLRYEPGTHRIVGLTVINARWLLDRDGRLTVTVPETVEASADELAPALFAA